MQNLSLQDAEAVALEYNRPFLIAQEETRQSQEQRGEALSRWFPALEYTAEYRQSQENELALDAYKLAFPYVKKAYSSVFELTQPLFSTDLLFGLKGRNAEYRAAQWGERQTRNNLLFAVRRNYYAVLYYQKALEIRQEHIDYMTYAYEQESGKLKAGNSTTLEVNRSSVAVSNSVSAYYSILKQEKMARNSLILNLGVNPLEEPNLSIKEQGFPVESTPIIGNALEEGKRFSENEIRAYVECALVQRSDLKQLNFTVDAKQQAVNEAKGDYLPKITSYLRYSSNDVYLGANPWSEQPYHWVGGVALTWNLFDSLLREHKVRKAKSAHRASMLSYSYGQEQAETEVRDILYRIEEAIFIYRASHSAVLVAEQAREQAQEKLQYGKIAPLEYRDAVDALALARNQNNQAGFDLMTAYYQLQLALGED